MDKALFRDPVYQQRVFVTRLTCKQELVGTRDIREGHEVTTLMRPLTTENNSGVVFWSWLFFLEVFLTGSPSMDEESRTVSVIGVGEFYNSCDGTSKSARIAVGVG